MKLEIQKNNSAYILKNINETINWGTTFGINKRMYAYHTVKPHQFDDVTKDRSVLMQETGLQHLITLKQIHSDLIHVISDQNKHLYYTNTVEGDALITSLPNVALGILTADCVPILFAIPGVAVAAVHAGWKGILSDIVSKTLQKLKSDFRFNLNDLIAFIAPHNRSCCYEVKEDLIKHFEDPIIRYHDKKNFLDMEAMIIRQINNFGISNKQILTLTHCTYCHHNPTYHSYRRKSDVYRNLTWISLK